MQELKEIVPPQNIEAEQSALGACLIEKEALDRVTEILPDPLSFYRTAHQEIYQAIQTLKNREEPIDIITLCAELRNSNKLEEAGGAAYLTYLIDCTPTTANAEYYAEIVKEKANLRTLLHNIIQAKNGIDSGRPKDEIINNLTNALLSLHRDDKVTVSTMADLAGKFYTLLGDNFPAGINVTEMVKTGIKEFDEKIGGFIKGILAIIAARPGMGKSALMEKIALNIAKNEKLPVAIFSFEIPDMILFARMLSKDANLNNDILMLGPTDQHLETIKNSCVRVSGLPIYFFFNPMSTQRMKAECQAIIQKHGSLGAVFIDRFQLIAKPWRGEKDHAYWDELSHELDMMARALHVPVILLTQLNRDCEKRADKRPVLSDLRDSGALEQDGKTVIFIYRDEYYNPESKDQGIAEINVAKNSFGKMGFWKMAFIKELPDFRSLAPCHISDENPF